MHYQEVRQAATSAVASSCDSCDSSSTASPRMRTSDQNVPWGTCERCVFVRLGGIRMYVCMHACMHA